jgi:hypothetical protein
MCLVATQVQQFFSKRSGFLVADWKKFIAVNHDMNLVLCPDIIAANVLGFMQVWELVFRLPKTGAD